MKHVVTLIRFASLGLFVYSITSGKMMLWLGIFAISLMCPSLAIVVSKADKKACIDTRICHQCLNCQLVCPKDAIHY